MNKEDSGGRNTDNLVFGKNSILECLESSPQTISKIWVMTDSPNPKLKEIELKAREHKIPVLKVDRKALDKISQGEDHRSVIAEISPITVYEEEYLFTNKDIRTILIPVNIEDPHNLGAIIRTAHAFDVDVLAINSRKSTPVNSTVVSTSAGAVFRTKIVRLGNISNVIRKLKDAGFWIYGTSVTDNSAIALDKIKFDAKTVLLVGNEGKGLGDLLQKQCDFSIYIPMKFESLNVSVATGVILNKVYQDARV